MAYAKQTWISRVRQYANRKLLVPTGNTNEYDETQVEGTVSVAGTPFTAARMNNIEDGIYQIDGPAVRSAVQSSYAAVLTMPASTKNGLVRGTLSGMTLNNAVVNGSAATSVTATAPSQRLQILLNGQLNNASPYSTANQVFDIKINSKYFIYYKLKPSSVGKIADLVGLVYSDNTADSNGTSGGSVSEVARIITATKSLKANVVALSGGTFGLTDRDFQLLIDMTSLGLDSLTADQMKDLCDNGYFEGLKGSDVEVVSVGKNLFDGKFNTGYVYSGGVLVVFAGWNSSNKIKALPSTVYSLSGIPTAEDGYIYQFDRSGAYLGDSLRIYKTDMNASFTTAPNCGQIAFGYSSQSLGLYPQLEKSATATTYEPFKQSTLSLDKTLNRVPNGVADTYDLATGVFTQNVQEYTLVAGDVTGLITGYNNIQLVSIQPPSGKVTFIDGIQGATIVSGFQKEIAFDGGAVGGINDSLSAVGSHATRGGNQLIYLYVALNAYANLAAAQTALAGTKILYQLATPVTTVYNKDLLSFESGTLYDNGLLPTYKQVTTPINVAGGLEDFSTNSANSEARHDTPILASGGHLADAFANIMLQFRTAIDKAVNYITIGNNIAGSAPYFEATGADTNIDLVADGKGTGRLVDKSLIKYLKAGEVNTSAVLSAEFTSTSTTYVQIPALTVAVTAGKIYNLTFTASHKHTAGNSSPISYSLYMPSGSGTIVGNVVAPESSSGVMQTFPLSAIGALGLAGSTVGPLLTVTNYNYGTTFNAVFTCATSGTISVGIDCTAAGTMAVKVGSGITVTPII